MTKVKGFLLAESMVALTLAIMGISLLVLIVGGTRTTEQKIELRTDRAYAWHVMKTNNLEKILVHNRMYHPVGTNGVYDETDQKTYVVKK
ncbi:hypothetical protein OZY43_03395 [Lactobacillus sp. ESL0785]|uniref:hypothetical protein n=1 Tax=Lactobacillus sp. ESL0785 TaxID=2983232 RepID=UPI0023F61798|nr:hypothetical protein [Lactobacillus sp. ESL0785]WEV71458.1 hypothetical protein OZY43_03395 [Lactobacillus sp. ESL0785]